MEQHLCVFAVPFRNGTAFVCFCCSFSKWNSICVFLLFLFEMERHLRVFFPFLCEKEQHLCVFADPLRKGTIFECLCCSFLRSNSICDCSNDICIFTFFVCIFVFFRVHFLWCSLHETPLCECFCCSFKRATLWEYFWGQPFPFSCGIIHSSAQPHSPDSLSWHEVHYFYEDKNYGFFWSKVNIIYVMIFNRIAPWC